MKSLSHVRLCNPIDCSLPGSSVHGIFQAIVLEWISISFSRGSSQPRAQIRVSHIVDRRFTVWATTSPLFIDKELCKPCFQLIICRLVLRWRYCLSMHVWSLDIIPRSSFSDFTSFDHRPLPWVILKLSCPVNVIFYEFMLCVSSQINRKFKDDVILFSTAHSTSQPLFSICWFESENPPAQWRGSTFQILP